MAAVLVADERPAEPVRVEPTAVLVVGYGSSLRGDDAVGQDVVKELRRRSQYVGALKQAQFVLAECLTPELAYDLARCGFAIVVDAVCDGRRAGEVSVEAVAAMSALGTEGGGADGPGRAGGIGCWEDLTPLALLRLARDLYGRSPAAAVVSVGVERVSLGMGLGAAVEAAVPRAVAVAEDALGAWVGATKVGATKVGATKVGPAHAGPAHAGPSPAPAPEPGTGGTSTAG